MSVKNTKADKAKKDKISINIVITAARLVIILMAIGFLGAGINFNKLAKELSVSGETPSACAEEYGETLEKQRCYIDFGETKNSIIRTRESQATTCFAAATVLFAILLISKK